MSVSKPALRPSFFCVRNTTASFWLVCVVLIGSLQPLAAQEAAEAAAPAKSMLNKWFLDGGIWMAPLVLCSVAAIGLTVLCLMTLSRNKFAPKKLKEELMQHMEHCRVRSAIETASKSSSFLGRMMTIALPHFDASDHEKLGVENVEDSMADFATIEIKPYQKWVGYFGVLAQVCPMLGLLGTVVGMVGAFDILSLTGGAAPSKLAGDIAVALLTTLGGLMVAIPSLALFFVFKNRLNDLVSESVISGMELVNAAVDAVHGEAKASRIPEGLSHQ